MMYPIILAVFLVGLPLYASVAQEVVEHEAAVVPHVQARLLSDMPAINRGFVRQEGGEFTFHVMAKAPTQDDSFGVASLREVGSGLERIKIFEMPLADRRIGRTSFVDLAPGSAHTLKIGCVIGARPAGIVGWNAPLSSQDLDVDWGDLPERAVTMPPAEPAAVSSFLFGSCNRFAHVGPVTFMLNKGARMFQAMADDIAARADEGLATDGVVTLGDWVYNDPLFFGIGEKRTFEEIAGLYDLTNTTRGAKALIQSGPPLYQVWDDHERYNDVTGEVPPDRLAQAQAGKRAYDLYQRPQGPQTPHNWFRIDDNIDGFVMDLRSDLLPSQSLAVSEEQLSALEAYLVDPVRAARLKPVFMSTTALCLQGDAWGVSKAQLRRLMDHIKDNHVRGVVFLAGDIHVGVSGLWRYEDVEDAPFVLEVVSSAFHKISHSKDARLRPRADLQSDPGAAPVVGPVLTAVQGLSHVTLEDNYTRVVLEHASLTVRVIRKDRRNRLLEDIVYDLANGTFQDTPGSAPRYARVAQ